jgi:hypothetical protein
MGLNIGGAKCLKLIGTTIPNVVAGNRGGSGAAQKAANANTKKGLGRFQPAQPPHRGTKGRERNQSMIAASPGGTPFTATGLNIGGAIPLVAFAPPGASGRQQNLGLSASSQLTTQSNPGFSASSVGGSGAAQAGGTSTTTRSNLGLSAGLVGGSGATHSGSTNTTTGTLGSNHVPRKKGNSLMLSPYSGSINPSNLTGIAKYINFVKSPYNERLDCLVANATLSLRA